MAADFFDYRLPTDLSFGARGGPTFNTDVAQATSGGRFANKNWAYPLHRFDISEAVRTKSDFEIIRSLFYNVAGRFSGFRFKDHADFEAAQATSSLVFITGTTWQMNRIYALGARTFVRPIQKPVSATAVVYRTRSAMVTVATASIDYATGIATISGHVAGDTYTWAGQFDVPVAFVADVMEAVISGKAGGQFTVEWPSIQLEEIRVT